MPITLAVKPADSAGINQMLRRYHGWVDIEKVGTHAAMGWVRWADVQSRVLVGHGEFR